MGQTNEILSCGVIMSKDKPFKTLETLLALNLAYKEFVDSPTDKNLETFLNLSAQYKESWIVDASNENISDSVSSKDLDAESDLRKELAEFDEEISGESLKKEVEQGDLGDAILSLTRRDALKYITKDRIGIHVSGSGLVKLMTSSIYIPPIKQLVEEICISASMILGDRPLTIQRVNLLIEDGMFLLNSLMNQNYPGIFLEMILME